MNISFQENQISQRPALRLLQNLGWQYLSQAEVATERTNKSSAVLLEDILHERINYINNPSINGIKSNKLTEQNINATIEALKSINMSGGYISACESVYNLLTLGYTVEQNIDGVKRSFNVQYIDWVNIENNTFHVVEEFEVSRAGRSDTYRPDIVLFVNGIPLCVIECKRPDIKDSISQAISQHIRNQQEDGIRPLFYYTGMLLSINTSQAKYGTNGTPEEFWSIWNEQFTNGEKQRFITELDRAVNPQMDNNSADLHITQSPQDSALFSLCRPDRLLELIHSFTIFENNVRKIARYPQYFAIKKVMERISNISAGKRNGGVIWHTQGSGKSLTMVMLSRAIINQKSIKNPKIVLVTDRTDLDKQITDTFRYCDALVENATTGERLVQLLESNTDAVITTLVHKFRTAIGKIRKPLESPNIFVLVDEAHRSQYGELAIEMSKTLPNACFIAMTGTPLMKKDKNTAAKFGGLIKPAYTVSQAVIDGAVVPLLYEGRHVVQEVQEGQIDRYFDLVTEDFTAEEKADFKRKFSNKGHLNIADQKTFAIAWDISLHYERNWKGTGFKGQLVCQGKATAIKYKNYFDEIGRVSTEVVISAPDLRESEEDVNEGNTEIVKAFYKKMMDRFGTQKRYEEGIVNQYKNTSTPEIIIVVSKLTTGFDAPKNTVLYLTKNMKDHEILQTTARVNRVSEGKDFGYIIDYYGVLKELHDALELYTLEGWEDIENTFTDIQVEIERLPQLHSEIWDIFKEVKNKKDLEAYNEILRDDEVRSRFYDKLTAFAKCLKLALSSIEFHKATEQELIDKYKSDLGMFLKLRHSVQERYAETIDYKKYEVKIQNLIDKHVSATSVEIVTELVNIFDKENFEQEVEKVIGKAAKADTIAHRTAKYISENIQKDPAFYEKFSKMLKDVIAEYKEYRNAEKYLLESIRIMEAVRSHTDSDIPLEIQENDAARAFYGLNYQLLSEKVEDKDLSKTISTAIALHVEGIIKSRLIIDWHTNNDLIDMMMLSIEDYYIDEVRDKYNIDISFDEIDSVSEKCISVAKLIYHNGR